MGFVSGIQDWLKIQKSINVMKNYRYFLFGHIADSSSHRLYFEIYQA